MKITKRKIRASSDYRSFDGYSLDELEELYPDYTGWALDLSGAETIYIPRNDENPYIGVSYKDGDTWIFGLGRDRKVSFSELAEYLSE